MTTAADLINLAFKDSGVFGTGQTPLAEDTADALRRLNMMLAQWSRRRWLVYCLIETTCACTGALYYTVKAGGDIDVARPDRIEYAFIRQQVPSNPSPVDWPLVEIKSREEYSDITLKNLAAAPSQWFFYDSNYPEGRFYPWPLPNSQYTLHVLTKAVLPQFAAATDNVILPPEYEEALYLNLAVRFRMAYRLPEDKVLTGLARAALDTIRASNFQVGRLRMPRGLTQGPAYNVYSDYGS